MPQLRVLQLNSLRSSVGSGGLTLGSSKYCRSNRPFFSAVASSGKYCGMNQNKNQTEGRRARGERWPLAFFSFLDERDLRPNLRMGSLS